MRTLRFSAFMATVPLPFGPVARRRILRFMATRYGDLTIVVPIFGTSAVFAVAASWLLLRDVERITWPIAGGAVFIMLGGVLVAWRIL